MERCAGPLDPRVGWHFNLFSIHIQGKIERRKKKMEEIVRKD
jgi:hypothetical protein